MAQIMYLKRLVVLFCLSALCSSGYGDYRVAEYVEGISIPWGMTWLPDGDMLVTSREELPRKWSENCWYD